MSVINTNVKALVAQESMRTSNLSLSQAMERLSTGSKINNAKDDAAGLAITNRMTSQIRGMAKAINNVNDAISLTQTAEGALGNINDILQRMRELAVQASNDTNNNEQRSYLDLEFQQLKQQIVQIADNTEWNGFPLLSGKAGQQVGEMPVFKATSKNQFGSVFIDPTTTRTIAGTGSGEQQKFTLTGTPAQGDITIAGQKVTISSTVATAGLAAVMTDIQRQLRATDYFATNSGRTVSTTAGGDVIITYNGTDGDKPDTLVNTGSTNLTPTVVDATTGSIISVERTATTGAQETFKDNGKFSLSGSLSFSFDTAVSNLVTAKFLTIDICMMYMTIFL